MKERFEHRLLKGVIKVTCKFQDGTVRTWKDEKEKVVSSIVNIVDAYSAKGYSLTLRQLHYQFVSHHPGYVNHDSAYKRLGKILDDCRYSGTIDWNAIVDRGRKPVLPYSVQNIQHALQDTIDQYRLNRQHGQENHVEVWTEKDALSDILSRPCRKYHVRLAINKGYTSSSAIYNAYERFINCIYNGQFVIVLYLGDHDPSGLDMIRDIDERMRFMLDNGMHKASSSDFKLIPIGLNMKQIKQYKLPENPTKLTDSRSPEYIEKFGRVCWEVDALDPDVLSNLVESSILQHINVDDYNECLKQEERDKKTLNKFIKTLK